MHEYVFKTPPVCTYVAVFNFLQHGCTYVYTVLTGLPKLLPLLTRPWFIVADRPIDRYVHRQRYVHFDRVVPTVREDKDALPSCEDIAGGSQLSGGRIIFLPVIRTHFLACEDVVGRSQLSGGENIIFIVKMMQLHACVHGRGASPLSASPCTVIFRRLLFVDHVDHTVLSAPRLP